MTRWTGATVAAALGLEAPAPAPAPAPTFRAVSTDTRSLAGGDLFVALVGERFDGHDYLDAARQAGAAGAVVRRGTAPLAGVVLFEVDDTLHALGRLARARRRDVAGPVVAITGTNGKTATKELVARALGTRWRVHATRANLNNEVGVPLTILSAPDDAEALVVEAGASVRGEIARLRNIIEPTVAMITNVSAGHLAGFGDETDVLTEKLALVARVPLAIVGTTPPTLGARARETAGRVVCAGLDAPADLRPDRWGLDGAGRVEVRFRNVPLHVPLAGRHQAENVMLALALADALALDLPPVAAALASVDLPSGRWEVSETRGRTVINDAYNANPASLLAALETVHAIRSDRPLVILVGSMLELGAATAAAHARCADAIVALDPALVGAVGEFVAALAPSRTRLDARLVTAADAAALGRAVAPRIPDRAIVLLKGSRGTRMERALPYLLPSGEVPCSTTS